MSERRRYRFIIGAYQPCSEYMVCARSEEAARLIFTDAYDRLLYYHGSEPPVAHTFSVFEVCPN